MSGNPLMLPTLDPPVEVPNGGEIEFDELIAGFEPVEQRRPRRNPEPPKEAPPEGA